MARFSRRFAGTEGRPADTHIKYLKKEVQLNANL